MITIIQGMGQKLQTVEKNGHQKVNRICMIDQKYVDYLFKSRSVGSSGYYKKQNIVSYLALR